MQNNWTPQFKHNVTGMLPITVLMAEDLQKQQKVLEHQTDDWGVSSCIDLYRCDLNLMQDEAAIRRFVRELCELIKMRRFGETQVVRFGDDPRVTGFSMTQLIETSLISAHFADNSYAIYLDVFSCAPYNPRQAAEFAAHFFHAETWKVQIVRRS
jgi:S-adenosylmethionine decarboxylase